jgi:UDPglucose 6-dehydrogenase
MKIAVIGAGYVGLVTAAGLAGLGHVVRLAESDPVRLALLQEGRLPIFEPDLEDLMAAGVGEGRLSFHAENAQAVADAEVVFVAVPTPQGASGAADTGIVERVVMEIAPRLEPGAVVALKSTTPTGSFRVLEETLARHSKGAVLAINPEFLREGSAVADFFAPDRVVVGATSDHAVARLTELFAKLGAPLVVTDPVSAAIVKYASNAYLATRISFGNAIASVCDAVGADVRDVLLGMGYDPRIGFHYLDPGPGFGGSCLPKDTLALVHLAESSGYDFALLRGVIEVNEQQLKRLLERIRDALGGTVGGRKVGLWGLTFKAGTDDVRDSPAVALAEALIADGAIVTAFDPRATEVHGVARAPSALEAARDADILVIATEWKEFQSVSLSDLERSMRGRAIVDARNLLDPDAVRRHGFTYAGVGR